MAQTNGWGQAHINNTISFGGDVNCGGGPSFDADYQAVLDYATTQGYTLPSAGQQTLQNTLVTDLKTAGVWDKLDAFSVFATDGDANFALIDWVRLTTQTAVNAPTFTTNQGYQGDGTSAYIDWGISPSTATNFQLNNCSFGYYSYGQGATDSGLNGCRSENGNNNRARCYFRHYDPDFDIVGPNDAAAVSSTTGSDTGLFWMGRQNSTNREGYVNGVRVINAPENSESVSISNFYTFAYNSENGAASFNSNKLSIQFTGGDLSAEASDFNTAVSTYLAAI
jgi:hypothetical protein